jgi:phospholipid-translocating ATPase
MSGAYQYRNPDEPGSAHEESSEDDLDLDELDPVGSKKLGSVRENSNRSKSSNSRGYGQNIALSNLRSLRRGRKWGQGMRAEQEGDEDDLQGLLEEREDGPKGSQKEENGSLSGFKKRGRLREQKRQAAGSRLASFRQSLQLPEALRSEFDEYNEDLHASNKESREIVVGQPQPKKYPPNIVSNAKYTAWSFLPRTLYNEFSFFLNIYFLLVALSQIIPYLRIGYMSTYIAPLAMVLTITIGKEAIDDIARRRRDAEANAEPYTVIVMNSQTGKAKSTRLRSRTMSQECLGLKGTWDVQKRSRDLKVGDILHLQKNQRLPTDVVILKSIPYDHNLNQPTNSAKVEVNAMPQQEFTTDEDSQKNADPTTETKAAGSEQTSGETFIRTDQLDGETDWKLRLPSPLTQGLNVVDFTRLKIKAGAPDKRVNDFVGSIELNPGEEMSYNPHVSPANPLPTNGEADARHVNDGITQSSPLTIDNTAWANTVIASNTTTLAVVIYTGRQTRSAMSTSPSRSKTGLLELEINNLTKILCALTLSLSIVLVALEGFEPTNKKPWYVAIMIYLILFSTIIPISLRVNLDMAKSVYARFIERDLGIPGTVVRTSTIPEDLGRIEYLLTDKTGTLTRNEMELKKIHVGTVSYANEAMEEVASYVKQAFSGLDSKTIPNSTALFTPSSAYFTQVNTSAATRTRREIGSRVRDLILALALCHNVTPTTDEVEGKQVIAYQASSPDEIAIVEYTERVGLRLVHRDRQSIALKSTKSDRVSVKVKILDIFPFTSDSKRMGIIVQFGTDSEHQAYENEVWFYQKGADTIMSSIVAANDWLDEETANMAREGLRTLVVGRKRLSMQQYQSFAAAYREASVTLHKRDAIMSEVVRKHLENDLELLGVTGVEDKLQKDVKPSLELLRNAGVKIWMLTGDKVETARCVAISAKLVSRSQQIHTIAKLRHKLHAQESLNFMRNKTDSCLLIDGDSLSLMLTHFRHDFISLAVLLPAVIACRCSPTQKAELATLIRTHTHKRICCIGDGGNDVSMIQAADIGIGIVGKEGRQASLAADFSITQFCHLTKLLVWHGRNSYKRSAKLAQFVIHRGLIISVCQTMYNIAGHFDPKGLFKDWLLVGYATVYTMAPVFSLVLDRDVDEHLANLYPELYKELKTGVSLSYRTFFTWVAISIYQGTVIQGLSQLLVGAVDGPRMLSVSFTVLVFNELIMVAVAVTTWHPIMICCIVGTGLLYAATVPFLADYFDLAYVVSWGWVWRVSAVAAVSLVPVWGGKVIGRAWRPPSYRKVRGV